MGKLDVLKACLAEKNLKKIKGLFTDNSKRVLTALKQYEIKDHEVMKRQVKIIKDGFLDQAKLPSPYQKQIVKATVAFLFGKEVKYIEVGAKEQSEGFKKFLAIKKDMRSHIRDRENARRVSSETESAKLFIPYRGADTDPYDISKQVVNLRCIILAKSLGDTLYTSFDEYGSMIAFARGYKVEDDKGKYVEHFDIYLADEIIFIDNADGNFNMETKKNLLGKIPVVYYSQEYSEWHDVQPLIERYEMINSKRADTNDYTADPILLLRGDAKSSLPGRDEVGKVIRLVGADAEASYLAPQMAVDMIKDERQTLENQIHYFTDTPFMNDEQMRSLGQDSGKALLMRFFPATLKAMSKQEMYSEMIDRENNIILAFMSKILNVKGVEDMEIAMEFGNPLPDNLEELITILSQSTGGKPIMSQETAVMNNPLVDDPKEEMAKLNAQAKEEALIFQQGLELTSEDE